MSNGAQKNSHDSLKTHHKLVRLESKMLKLFAETEKFIRKGTKSSKRYFFLSWLFGFLFLVVFFFLIYTHTQLDKKFDLLQEQIDYLNTKDNFLEKNLKKIIQYQEDLLSTMQEKQEITVEVARAPLEERPTPFDHIKREQIEVQEDKFIIYSKDFRWSYFTDTKSMVPVIGASADGIEIIPSRITDIHIGDIISYQLGDDTIIHRVVKIGQDEQGWYAIAKADNLRNEDPHKIRFEQIQGILVGIIY